MTEYKSKVKYEAPIEINIEEDFPDYGSMAVSETENMICSAVLKVGITVDKEELIKALRYDRGQYEKGYADGKRDAAAAIEALQAEIRESMQRCAECGDELAQQLPKRGKWVEENRRPRSSQFVCSERHRTAYDPQPTRDKAWRKRCRYAYCPNCGAKMNGEQNVD